jgi:hypothetical protein
VVVVGFCALAACRQPDSIVFLQVDTRAPLPAVERLRVVTSNDGLSDTRFFPEAGDPAHPVHLPASLVLVVPRGRAGSVHVAVDALGPGDQPVGSGETDLALVRGKRADGRVSLSAGARMTGADGGVADAASTDAASTDAAAAAEDGAGDLVSDGLAAPPPDVTGSDLASSDSGAEPPAWTAINPPPLPTTGYTFIATTLADRCWVKDGVPNCLNNKVDFPGSNYRQFSLYNEFGDTWCLIRTDNSVTCGRIPNVPPATEMVFGPYWFCLHETSGRFSCVGGYRHEEVTAFFAPFNTPMKSLVLTAFDYGGGLPGGADAICGISAEGKLVCDKRVNDQAAAWTGVVDAVLSKENTCGLLVDGRIVCAKNNDSTDNYAPDVAPGTYVRLAEANGSIPIALTAAGDAVYFAQDSLGTWTAKVAIKGELVSLLSAGNLNGSPPPGMVTICGLTYDGRVKCNDPRLQFGN